MNIDDVIKIYPTKEVIAIFRHKLLSVERAKASFFDDPDHMTDWLGFNMHSGHIVVSLN